jgi:hypothetical protein
MKERVLVMLGDIVKNSFSPILESNLKSYLHMSEEDRIAIEKSSAKLISVDELIALCSKHDINAEHIYATGDWLAPFCYYDFPVLWVIDVLDDNYWETLKLGKHIPEFEFELKSRIDQKEFKSLLTLLHDRSKVLIFNKIYWMVPNEERFEFWYDFYIRLDYGHSFIDNKIFKDAFEHKPELQKQMLTRYLDYLEKGDFITIYRGEGENSIHHDESLSWTLSMTVAGFFATRYESKSGGRIYKGKVRKKDILMYSDDRNEDEVIVDPKYVMDVEKVPMVTIQSEWSDLQKEGYIDEYLVYRNSFIKEAHYKDSQGIHGVNHVKRVLLHAITLSSAMGLTHAERAILANASIYHDIGRKHDGHCTMHGEWSWRQYERTIMPETLMYEVNSLERKKSGNDGYDIRKLTGEEVKIIRFIMEYHCRDDEDAEEALKKLHFKRKSRVWRLFQIFKDCDGLDRVRLPLKELDVKYFRMDETKKRLLFAFQVKVNRLNL